MGDAIIRRVPVTVQPLAPARINGALYALNTYSPVGASGFYLPLEGSRIAVPATGPSTSATQEFSASRFGRLSGANGNGAISSAIVGPNTLLNAAFSASGAASCVLVCKALSASGHGTGVSPVPALWATGSSVNHYPFTNGLLYLGPFSVTRYVNGTVSGASAGIYEPHVFIATHKSGAQACYVNGKLLGSATAVETPSLNSGTGFGNYGTTYWAAFFDYILSDGEISEYSKNPLRVFAPQTRRIWAPAAAAGGTTITGALGTAVATGYTATVNANRTIAGSVGTATASGYTATVNANRTVAGSVGTATASGFTASLNINKTISGAVGEVVASGYQATVTTSGNTTITGIVGVATASGYTATVNANRTIASTVGVATASGYTATISNSADTTINGSVGIAVATGFSALINANRTITGSTGTVVASGYTGTVSNGGLTDAEFRQMYDWLAALSAIDYLTVPKFIALK